MSVYEAAYFQKSATTLTLEYGNHWQRISARGLRSSSAVPPKDLELQELQQRLICPPETLATSGDSERPSKRARLSDQNFLEHHPRTRERLIEDLCRLLSPQKPCDFTGLHLFAA